MNNKAQAEACANKGKLSRGNTLAAAKSGLDLTMATAGFAGGPIGFTVLGLYFVIDQTIGWENASKSYIEVEKKRKHMIDLKIISPSDFKN